MQRTPVKSSNVVSVGWEADQPKVGTLEVEFKGGGVYRYEDVPRDVYEELLESESIGSFIQRRIRGQYPTSKVSDGKETER